MNKTEKYRNIVFYALNLWSTFRQIQSKCFYFKWAFQNKKTTCFTVNLIIQMLCNTVGIALFF